MDIFKVILIIAKSKKPISFPKIEGNLKNIHNKEKAVITFFSYCCLLGAEFET